MVGQMHSRLGILRIYLNYEHNVYAINDDYLGIAENGLNNFHPAFQTLNKKIYWKESIRANKKIS